MVDPVSIPKVGSTQAPPQTDTVRSTENGTAFKALLEQLAERARELEKTSAKPVDATELAGAVEEAHGSLQEALSLSDQLIEAYRAQRRRDSPPPA